MISNMVRYSRGHTHSVRCKELLRGKTVTRRLKVMKICYWGHVLRRPANHMLGLAERYARYPKKIGRPSYTDKDGMKEAFSKYPLTVPEWKVLAESKVELKKQAEVIYDECLDDTSSEEEEVPF